MWPQDLEFGFLLEVLRKLELGLGVQLAVALVDRDLVGGPEHALLKLITVDKRMILKYRSDNVSVDLLGVAEWEWV